MQFRILSAALVFLGSYFPLSLILALQDVSDETWGRGICLDLRTCSIPDFDNPWLSIIGVVFTGICFFLTLYVISKLRFKYPVVVLDSKPIPGELIGYSFPYIVSFMGVDYGSIGKISGLIVFLVWFFLITYKAGQVVMNPVLLVLGWNLFEVRVSINGHERNAKILSKKHLRPGRYLCQDIQGSFITNGERGDE
ncbi:MAG: hypothetical protein V4794_09105 [Pseudomonadota bacterium]